MAYTSGQTGKLVEGSLWQRSCAAGTGYAVTTNSLNILGVAEVAFMLIKNPSGSGKNIRVYEIKFGIDGNVNDPSIYRVYRDPTITTNGTAITIRNRRKSGAASAMEAYTAPTVSANGSLLDGETFTSIEGHDFQDLGWFIEPGEDILITIDPTLTNLSHIISLEWIEETT